MRVGDTLHSDTGSWLGKPSRFTYRFQRHKTGGPYATVQDGPSNTYLLSRGDAGYVFRVQVTAYNPTPSEPVSSEPTTLVRHHR